MSSSHPDWKQTSTTGGKPLAALIPSYLTHPLLVALIGLLSGAAGVFSFSPFHFWPGCFLSLAVFSTLIITSHKAKTAFLRSLSVALGFFGAGVSWVYVSIAQYGQVGDVIAVLITLFFVLALSLFWATSGWLSWHLIQRFRSLPPALFIMLCLLIGEYARSTLFTGFPWLLPGYAIQNTWLFELLPIGGVWLTTAVVILSACLLPSLLLTPKKAHITLVVITLAGWFVGAYLTYNPIDWVKQTGKIKTTLVQGNIKQDEKWLPETAAASLAYYQQASVQHLDSDLIVWPETAITYMLQKVKPYLSSFTDELMHSKTTLITGVPDYDPLKHAYYNAIWATGNGFGLYYKQHLVPFGEYIPLASIVGPLLDVFGMPMSSFQPGEKNQPVLQAGEWGVAPFICYEIVYPEQVREMVRDSDFLVTISNDGWFGSSFGPWQHLQIAQFRAKETGRYVIRSTNTGISAIIDENGNIVDQAPQFQSTTITSEVKAMSGITPYVRWGYWAVVIFSGLCLVFSFLSSRMK